MLLGAFAAVTSLPVAYFNGGANWQAAIVWGWLTRPTVRLT